MKIIKNILLFTVLTLIAISCETEITYNQPILPVQTNGLPNYLLGHFNDPVYGGSSASIVSQMSLAQFPPVFQGDSIVLDSIVLTIPYFSTPLTTDTEGNTTFDVDSIFGNSPIRLSVFQNNFFLRDFDPDADFNQGQRYFSNGSTSLADIIPDSQLENLLLIDTLFTPNLEQINLTVTDTANVSSISERLAPSLRLKLNNPNNFWEDLIFNREGDIVLDNINNFNNHFRGIYIKAEPLIAGGDGSMVLIDLASNDSNITLHYTPQTINDDGVLENENPQTLVLSFSGNTVNIFDNNFISIPNGDEQNGDEQLFLKGGEGSMAVINLFNGDENGNSEEFQSFKDDFAENGELKRIINEAFIEFTVDQTIVQGEEPNRVYIYDLNNNIPLVDYFLDQSLLINFPEARNIHLRPLRELTSADGDIDPNGGGETYRIRITEHINNLILRDSTNVKLGLVVAANVDTPSTANQFLQDDSQITGTIPVGAILSPRGTVLIGNNTTDEARRVQFRVFFTEPNNK